MVPLVRPADLAKIWDMPLPEFVKRKFAVLPVEGVKFSRFEKPPNLIDPQHSLDHFYRALLKGGTVRVVHYGDSPTTGDLITADARAMFQKQFGDAGTGFLLIAKPWAWYYRRGIGMDSSNWTI